MKIKIMLIAFVMGIVGGLSAKEVPQNIAEKVAINFYYQHVNQLRSVDFNKINLSLSKIESKNSQSAFYAFNVNNDEGFVIVSSQNSVQPVLAYAFKGEFNKSNMQPGQEDLLNWYSNQISYAAEKRMSANEDIANQWEELISYSPSKNIKTLRNVEPLLLVNWNQGWPYNALCPEDAAGLNGHVPVGCVATAMLQVMKHWNYPETGTGSVTSYNNNNGGYGTRTVNFSTKTYNWESMPLSANGENEEMAEINYHAGVAVSMHWAYDGSGAFTKSIEVALEDYFQYDTDCDYIEKRDYSTTEYNNTLKGQLDAKLPMVYSGSSTSSGHAWNCDGYMDDKYHMNWGWGGSGDGYYTLDDLIFSATSGGDEYNFIYDQEAVINIYPESDYPEYCTGSKTIVSPQGAFGDGSANEDYYNNVDCEYLISPECGNIIRLSFDKFDLADGDVIHIYDGINNSAPLLATYDADNTPGNSSITGNNGNILIEFLTDGSEVADGWYASFTSDYCSGRSYYTDASGSIGDGSGSCNYTKSTVCFWNIEPEGAEAVKLDFTQFDLAADGDDYINIYENTNSNLIGTFNADNIPATVIVNAPKAIILFYANYDDNTGGGWEVNYSTTTADVENHELIHGVSVYPNPTTENVNITYSLSKPANVNIRVYNMLGKTLGETQIYGEIGYQKMNLNSVIDFPESGFYFIDITVDNEKITKKISVIK
jgi:hypothetical protein